MDPTYKPTLREQIESQLQPLHKDAVKAILVSEALFKKIEAYTYDHKLVTSDYNHGHGVVRKYSFKYCLQMNYENGSCLPTKFYVKDGGREPSKYRFGFPKPDLERMRHETPSFESIYRNILRKYPNELLRTYTSTRPKHRL